MAVSSSKYPLIRETLSLLGAGQTASSFSDSLSLIFFENLQTITPTPPSFFRDVISRAFRSNHTLRPSLICSFSTLLFRSTSAPATPFPQTVSPDRLSMLQHSGGSMLFETSVEAFGRLSNNLCSRMHVIDQCNFRAAR